MPKNSIKDIRELDKAYINGDIADWWLQNFGYMTLEELADHHGKLVEAVREVEAWITDYDFSCYEYIPSGLEDRLNKLGYEYAVWNQSDDTIDKLVNH